MKEWMNQRWDSTRSSKVGQMLPQWQSQSTSMTTKHDNDDTSMTTSSQTTTYNLQEPKKKHKKPSSSKTQNGHDQNRPTSCNLQKIWTWTLKI